MCILANIWKSEIRTFSPFWPSERRRHELPLRERFLGGAGTCPPPLKFFEFSLSRIAENAPNLLTLIKSVQRFQQIDRTLRRCVYVYSYSWFRTRFPSISKLLLGLQRKDMENFILKTRIGDFEGQKSGLSWYGWQVCMCCYITLRTFERSTKALQPSKQPLFLLQEPTGARTFCLCFLFV